MKNTKNLKKENFSNRIYFQVEDILFKKDVLADIKVTIKRKDRIIKIRLNNNKSFCVSYEKYGKKKILDDDRNKQWIKLLEKSINKQLKKSSFKKSYIINLNDNVKLSNLKNVSNLEEIEIISPTTIVCYAGYKDISEFINLNDSKVKVQEDDYVEIPSDEIKQIEDINENIEEIVTQSRSIKSRSRALKQPYLTRIGDSKTNNNNVYPENLYVFVLDTGIYEHADLNINKEMSMDFTDSSIGWSDRIGHGTHVAGTIGAKNSSFAVAPGVTLIAHKVLADNGRGSTENIIRSLTEIEKFKQKNPSSNVIVNMSLGRTISRSEAIYNAYNTTGYPTKTTKYKKNYETLIQKLISLGVTFMIAAGNSTIDASAAIPGRVPEAITVGAYVFSNNQPNSRGPNNNIATFSNFGYLIDIMSPGVDIYSTWHGYIDDDTEDNKIYSTISGTSMATPIVTGAVVNMIKVESVKNPGKILTPSEIKQRLQDDSIQSYNVDSTLNRKIVMENKSESLCWRPQTSIFTEGDCKKWWLNTNNLEKTRPYSLYIGPYTKDEKIITNY